MPKPRKALRVLLVLAWVGGILAPMYSFRRFSASYQAAFDWVFRTHASHVLMHTFLYAVLACFLCALSARPMRSPVRILVCVLPALAVVAGLQEAIQMSGKQIAFGGDELFDILVDLNGGFLGTLLCMWLSRRGTPSGGKGEPSAAGNAPPADERPGPES